MWAPHINLFHYLIVKCGKHNLIMTLSHCDWRMLNTVKWKISHLSIVLASVQITTKVLPKLMLTSHQLDTLRRLRYTRANFNNAGFFLNNASVTPFWTPQNDHQCSDDIFHFCMKAVLPWCNSPKIVAMGPVNHKLVLRQIMASSGKTVIIWPCDSLI